MFETSGTLKFTLPVPPSANRYWRKWQNRVVLTAEARAYKQEVAMLLGCHIPLACEVGISYVWYRARKSGDLDNRQKVLFDALNGVIWNDDKQVCYHQAFRRDDKHNARIVATVFWGDAIPQLDEEKEKQDEDK